MRISIAMTQQEQQETTIVVDVAPQGDPVGERDYVDGVRDVLAFLDGRLDDYLNGATSAGVSTLGVAKWLDEARRSLIGAPGPGASSSVV